MIKFIMLFAIMLFIGVFSVVSAFMEKEDYVLSSDTEI